MSTTAATSATSTNTILQNYLTAQAATQASSTSSSSSSTSSANPLAGNLNTFLTILTTQLQNQDPTAATDTNQFTQELVEFAGVEQQINTNTDLSSLISLQQSSNSATAALGYIGKYVEAPTTNQLPLQNGASELGYTLPSGVSNVAITVMNSSGQTVNTLSGTTTSGANYVSWDGKDSSGNQLADGTYTFNLVATDSAGGTMTVTNEKTVGLVTSVATNSDGTTNLSLGSMSILSTAVDNVFASGSLPSATAV